MARQPTSYNVIQKRLQKQAGGQFDVPEDGAVVEPQLAPPGYGVFAQGYAGALQQGAADPFFGNSSTQTLARLTDEERAQVAATTDADRQASIFSTIFKNPELLKDPRAMSRVDFSQLGRYGQIINPVTTMADAAIARSGEITGNNKVAAEGLKLSREAGITVDEPTIENAFGNPVTGTPATGYGLFDGNRTPDEVAKGTTADAAMMNAKSNMIDATNPLKYNRKSGGSGGDGSGVTTSFIIPVAAQDGQAGGMMTIKGKDPAAVRAAANATRQVSPALAEKRAAAARRGFKVQDVPDGGIVVSSGRTRVRFDANGKRVK